MKRHVLKYPFPLGVDRIMIPAGNVVLVGTQIPGDLMPTVWVEHDADNILGQNMELVMFGTGHEINNPAYTHVGSVVCGMGSLVWHVYRAR